MADYEYLDREEALDFLEEARAFYLEMKGHFDSSYLEGIEDLLRTIENAEHFITRIRAVDFQMIRDVETMLYEFELRLPRSAKVQPKRPRFH